MLRLEDWARTGSMSRIKALALRVRARLLGSESRVAARALHLVAWHPLRNRQQFVTTTLRLASSLNRTKREKVHLDHSIILKRPVSEKERGILLTSFEPQLQRLSVLSSLRELETRYAIVFLPTWQPLYSEALFDFAARATRPYWIMPSSSADQALCADFGDLCNPLPFQASSWVSRNQYGSARVPKTVDLLMVANFSSYKRHWRLFEAIPTLPKTTRIVLAGRPNAARTVATLLDEADAFGVKNRIQIRENPTDQELAELIASARLFCALSHKEGSYIAIAEALMANTPVAMFADAVVGSKEYICAETGFLLDHRRPLGTQLLSCLRSADTMAPRAWAQIHISAEINCPKLNGLLRRDMARLGDVWTVDIEGFFCRHFDFEYLNANAEARFRPEYRALTDQIGLDLKRPQSH